jgi:hypothetical protein
MNHMKNHTCRDWRGMKHHLGHYSTSELVHLLDVSKGTCEEIALFMEVVQIELMQRAVTREPSIA